MKVLIFDPRPDSRDALRRAFSSLGWSVRGFSAADEAARALRDFDPEVVVADSQPVEGHAFLVEARRSDPRRLVYGLVDASGLDRAVEAVAAGAHDFLWRPVSEPRVAQLADAAVRRREAEAAAERTRLRLVRAELRDAMPGRSPRWLGALAEIERAAEANASVLLTGESGTEKDEAALALHRLSPRGSGPFAYISEWESLDLATRQAGSGTLFLGNLEATSGAYQEALLARILSAPATRFVVAPATRFVVPPGTRFIVATDESVTDGLAAGHLLRPLIEALSERTVHLPPLRERDGDIPLLARRFLEDLDPNLSLDPDALEVLEAHDWPGNTRELKEAVRRAARLSEAVIGPTLIRSVLGRPVPRAKTRARKPPIVKIAVGDSLADVERRLISKTLEFARGNKRKTAELLKLSLKTIYNKIKAYGLEGSR